MKDTFRKSMRWFHTWTSLVLGWLLFFMFLTGTIGYFEKEISRWMQPELPMAPIKFTNQELTDIAVNYLKKEGSDSQKWRIYLPDSRDDRLRVSWYPPTKNKKASMGHGRGGVRPITKIIDPNTKKEIKPRETGGGSALYRMHYTLQYVDARTTGRYIVGFASMLMLIGLITGIVIHINIFKDFFTFRQDKNIRSWLDAHIVTGILAIPFHIMITYSGLAFFIFMYMPGISMSNYDGKMMKYIQEAFPSQKAIELTNIKKPLAPIVPIVTKAEEYFDGKIKAITILNQGDSSSIVRIRRENTTLLSGDKLDRVYFSGTNGEMINSLHAKRPKAADARSIITGLHRGLFADIYVRWLYFLSGVLGTIMIASGLVIWTKKREKKQANTFGFKLVDNLNIASIAGLPVAIAAYFWANRLIPIDIPKRADMEIDTMFITWAIMLIFAIAVSSRKVWYVQFYLAAVLYLLLPVSNFFLTDRHLGITISHGDWVLVWMDLMFIVIGVIFTILGYKAQQKFYNFAGEKSVNVKSRRRSKA